MTLLSDAFVSFVFGSAGIDTGCASTIRCFWTIERAYAPCDSVSDRASSLIHCLIVLRGRPDELARRHRAPRSSTACSNSRSMIRKRMSAHIASRAAFVGTKTSTFLAVNPSCPWTTSGNWCGHVRPVRLARRLPDAHGPAQEARVQLDKCGVVASYFGII